MFTAFIILWVRYGIPLLLHPLPLPSLSLSNSPFFQKLMYVLKGIHHSDILEIKPFGDMLEYPYTFLYQYAEAIKKSIMKK